MNVNGLVSACCCYLTGVSVVRCPGTNRFALAARMRWQMRRSRIRLLTDPTLKNSLSTGMGMLCLSFYLALSFFHKEDSSAASLTDLLFVNSILFTATFYFGLQVLHPATVGVWLCQCQNAPACGGLLPWSDAAPPPLSLRGGERGRLRAPRKTKDHGFTTRRNK